MPATSLPTSSRLEKRATPICEPLMRQIPFDYSDCVAAIAYINANSYNTNGEIQIFGPVYGANERFNKKKWTYGAPTQHSLYNWFLCAMEFEQR